MASSCCEISFTWNPDRPPASLTTYTFIDVSSRETLNEENSNVIQPQNHLILTRIDENSPSDNCVLLLQCPDSDFAQINGISIVSESRTLEISNETDGYLTTVRGKKISTETDKTESEDDSTPRLFSCSCYFEESYSNLAVKFMSLGKQDSFCLHSLEVNILQYPERQQESVRGTFDMYKLKKDIDDMGESVSDRAKDFLATMEQFEKNKAASFESFMKPRSLSMYLSSPSNQGFSSMMSSILGTGAMTSLFGKSGGQQEENEEQDMFKMLQAVCGSVTSMRTAAAAKQQENVNSQADSPDSGEASISQTLSMETDGEAEQHAVSMDVLTAFVDQKMSQFKNEMHSELMEVKQEFTKAIEEAKDEVNKKLDEILLALNALQNQPKENQ